MIKSNEEMQVDLNEKKTQALKLGCKKSQRGASMVEYALLVGLVTVVAIAGIKALGGKVSAQFSSAGAQL